MPNDNAEQLQKLAGIFNLNKLLTTDDIDSVAKSLIKVLANNKKSYEEATKNHQENNQVLFNQVVEAHSQLRREVLQQLEEHKNGVLTESQSKLEEALKRMDEVADRVEQMIPNVPKDGKDADPDAITDAVLARISLPEQKELDLEDLVSRMGSLKGKKRLSIKAIEGLDKFLQEWADKVKADVVYKSVGRVIGGGNFKAGSGITIAGDGTISSTATGSGYTVETPTGTVNGSNTSFTVTATPVYIVSDGTTYFENNGYTLSGLTVTMSVAPTGYIRSFHS